MGKLQYDEAAEKAWGMGLVAAGALAFSTTVLFTRALSALPVLSIAFFRAFGAFVFFSLLLPWHRQTLQPGTYRAAWPYLVGLGLAISGAALLYVFAIQHTTVANAALLVNTAPLYVAFLGPRLLHEAVPRYRTPGLLLALIGLVLISGVLEQATGAGNGSGLLAGVGSGLAFAAALLLGGKLRGQVSALTQTWWSTGIASLLMAPWGLRTPATWVAAYWPLLAGLGTISLGLGYALYFQGLKRRVSTQVVSVIALLEPVSGTLLGALVLGEIPSLLNSLGIGLVLLAIYLITR